MADSIEETEENRLSSAFDVRLVGRRKVLTTVIRRQDDSTSGAILCDLSISDYAGRHPCPSECGFRIVAMTCEEATSSALVWVSERGERIRNITRFRYDFESGVHLVDAAIRKAEEATKVPRREALLSVSVLQVEQMIEELPMEVTNHVERMMLDTFKVAIRNVIGAAYDEGYRDGLNELGRRGRTDLFDYDQAAEEFDFSEIE